MRPAAMDRRIRIERSVPDTSFDGAGQDIWVPVATVWAEVRQQGGREYLTDGFNNAERRRVFFIRWMDGVTAAHRVVYEGKPHDIQEVREIGRHDGIELHTKVYSA